MQEELFGFQNMPSGLNFTGSSTTILFFSTAFLHLIGLLLQTLNKQNVTWQENYPMENFQVHLNNGA